MFSMTEAAKYKAGEFEGPLDLLLFLIRKNEIFIYDIPIAEITRQFLLFIQTAENLNLDNLTEFYEMAATLLFIKSKMLLPVDVDIDDDFEDPRMEIVEKLIEYQKFKRFSVLMAEREEEMEWTLERTHHQRNLPFEDTEPMWEEMDVWNLVQTFTRIVSSLSIERIFDVYEEVSINEKTSLIYEILEEKESFLFTELIVKSASKLEIICAFLAVLEAVRSRMIMIFQNRLFGDIQIRRPNDEANSVS